MGRDGAEYKEMTPEDKAANEEKSMKELEQLEQAAGHTIKKRVGVLTSSNPMPPGWKPRPAIGPPPEAGEIMGNTEDKTVEMEVGKEKE